MIITTQRSSIAQAIDATLTALGWIGFFYLFTKGVASIIDGTYDSPRIAILDPFLPTATTLAAYLLVAAFNALLLVLWARYRKLFFKDLRRVRAPAPIDDASVAQHFRLSCNQLREIQDSRVTVIYHAPDGAIAHLETDQLRMQRADDDKAYVAVKVA
ncbi:poly-beta-1,6-N-acetyl-D-glucosamine biosynthesis protein PgaD [Pollutimonas bauzanensis]|uniref:Biofilm PGA synthesis protein PgaD n=1 Tax=Pollutimonas bauzanensis TaxID=658167 RepID=A0A1M6AJE2_9BURK|nr:poly-beta-1,6-N-acetyl-D-glucosamine biosynthesis protein PgaD [Pollutimonas bauzanensis]SHI36448.1 biofilm PGA synthesis protein PgaD [Pollutimonas bauzanensis]